MSKQRANPKRRSGCPLNASVEILGDRWSLLIIRDMMLQGFRTYKEFLGSYERIATNILADRLQKLMAHGIITMGRDSSDGRKLIYSLTPKGIDLAPVLTEMVLWAAAHEDTANQALVRQMRKDKEQFISTVRRRWAETTRAADHNVRGKRKPAPDTRQRAFRPSLRTQRLRDVHARGAGSTDATTAAASNMNTEPTTGKALGVCIFSKALRASRTSTYPHAAPATTPAVAITAPSAMTLARSCRGCAPIANRTPNSRVRALTENANTPATPTSAIARATAAKIPNTTVLRRSGVRTSARTSSSVAARSTGWSTDISRMIRVTGVTRE